jgi:hypothetical protein
MKKMNSDEITDKKITVEEIIDMWKRYVEFLKSKKSTTLKELKENYV